MTLNIETNIDEQIKKCDELLAKYEKLEEHSKKLHFITIRELAEMRKCSISTAQYLFSLPDFPTEDFRQRKGCIVRSIKRMVHDKKKQERL